MERDYYKILGVNPDASEKDIKKAYHQKAREIHPDKASSPEEREKFEHEFAAISKAYNVLKEAEKRAEYDKQLKISREKAADATPKPQAFSVSEKSKETISKIVKNVPSSVKQAAISSAERGKIAQKAFTKGVQLFNAGDYIKAIEFFEAAISNDDSDPSYFAKLGLSIIKARKSFSKAVECMQTAINMDPYNMDYKLHLAEIYESAGSFSNAKKIYEEILKWDAGNAKAQRRLSYLNIGNKSNESFFVNLYKKLFKR